MVLGSCPCGNCGGGYHASHHRGSARVIDLRNKQGHVEFTGQQMVKEMMVMFTLKDRPGVYAISKTWHVVDGEDPLGQGTCIYDGRKRCRVAVDATGRRFCVAPGRDLPASMTWLEKQ